jgi:hypothetical protein
MTKKPIWGVYNYDTSSGGLLKFATTEINNASMRASYGSAI